jgi:hypothetical protein
LVKQGFRVLPYCTGAFVSLQDPFFEFWADDGKPHLTRRWSFGRVTEGLPTTQELGVSALVRMSD